jgi:hypothetical protein
MFSSAHNSQTPPGARLSANVEGFSQRDRDCAQGSAISPPRHTSPVKRALNATKKAARCSSRGREGVLHGGERELFERRQARARPAGRGDGARQRRGHQGQGRVSSLPRQQARRRLLPHRGPPPHRRLSAASAASPRLRPTQATLPTSHAFPRQPLPRRPGPHCMRSRARRTAHCPGTGGIVAEGVVRGVTASVAAPEWATAEPYTSSLLTAGGCVHR